MNLKKQIKYYEHYHKIKGKHVVSIWDDAQKEVKAQLADLQAENVRLKGDACELQKKHSLLTEIFNKEYAHCKDELAREYCCHEYKECLEKKIDELKAELEEAISLGVGESQQITMLEAENEELQTANKWLKLELGYLSNAPVVIIDNLEQAGIPKMETVKRRVNRD